MMVDIKLNWKYLKSNCVKPGLKKARKASQFSKR